MPNLVEASDVQLRLTEIPRLVLPSSVTAERLQAYIQEASSTLLALTGHEVPPVQGSISRQALDGLCVRLVVNSVRSDLFGDDLQALDSLRRGRRDLLDEAMKLQGTTAAAASVFFELSGAS